MLVLWMREKKVTNLKIMTITILCSSADAAVTVSDRTQFALYDVSRSDERIALHTVKINLAAFHHPNKNAGDGKQSRDSEHLILIFDVCFCFFQSVCFYF